MGDAQKERHTWISNAGRALARNGSSTFSPHPWPASICHDISPSAVPPRRRLCLPKNLRSIIHQPLSPQVGAVVAGRLLALVFRTKRKPCISPSTEPHRSSFPRYGKARAPCANKLYAVDCYLRFAASTEGSEMLTIVSAPGVSSTCHHEINY